MKHAILIVAHTQFDLLLDVVRRFDDDFSIFIHVDKKVCIPRAIHEALLSSKRVRLVGQPHRVNWGGRSIVDAVLWLCRTALFDTEGTHCDYFHLISGADFPVKGTCHFKKLFEKYAGRCFIEFFRLPDARWYRGGTDRLLYRHPMDRINWQNPLAFRKYERYVNYQRLHLYSRPLPGHPVYGGSAWWSLTREAVAYICEHANDNGWYDRLEDTFAPDEMFAQTVLLNSCLKGTLINDNLRYVDWETRDGHSPALLDERDALAIRQSSALFARKMDSNVSRRLMEELTDGMF